MDTHARFSRFVTGVVDFGGLQTTFSSLVSAMPASRDKYFYSRFRDYISVDLAYNLRKVFTRLDERWYHYDERFFVKSSAKGRRVAVKGLGPATLRAAVELAFLGFEVTVFDTARSPIENEFLPLWGASLADLRSLGLRDYFRSVRSDAATVGVQDAQLTLMKTALLLGVTFLFGKEVAHVKVPGEAALGSAMKWELVFSLETQESLAFDYLISDEKGLPDFLVQPSTAPAQGDTLRQIRWQTERALDGPLALQVLSLSDGAPVDLNRSLTTGLDAAWVVFTDFVYNRGLALREMESYNLIFRHQPLSERSIQAGSEWRVKPSSRYALEPSK